MDISVDDILGIHEYLMRKHETKKMFGFLKKFLFTATAFFGCNALKCIVMNKKECKIRSEIIDVNSNELIFYPYSSDVNKCSGNCDNILCS